MARAFIGIGSNITPERQLRAALRLLAAQVSVVGISTIYRTPPVDGSAQPDYYNGVVEIVTELPPDALKADVLRRIEDDLGRQRGGDKYAPRTIDLDLLLYDGDARVPPDPEIATRPFLAIPLQELAPALEVPGLGHIAELANVIPVDDMEPLPEYTRALRKEITHES